jgi:hypothetical protein
MTHLIGWAAELDALSHRALKLPLGRTDLAYEARSELAHALGLLANRIRSAAAPAKTTDRPVKPIKAPVVPGIVQDRRGNVVHVEFRAPRAPKKTAD